jgi:hypothetical protein
MTSEVDEDRLVVGHGVVSCLITRPPEADAVCVFAHGAGAGMRHLFMDRFSVGLAERRVASLRFQFPYMERGSGHADRSEVAHATVRTACEKAARAFTGMPVFAGGASVEDHLRDSRVRQVRTVTRESLECGRAQRAVDRPGSR